MVDANNSGEKTVLCFGNLFYRPALCVQAFPATPPLEEDRHMFRQSFTASFLALLILDGFNFAIAEEAKATRENQITNSIGTKFG